jgi:hypothetical protein
MTVCGDRSQPLPKESTCIDPENLCHATENLLAGKIDSNSIKLAITEKCGSGNLIRERLAEWKNYLHYFISALVLVYQSKYF